MFALLVRLLLLSNLSPKGWVRLQNRVLRVYHPRGNRISQKAISGCLDMGVFPVASFKRLQQLQELTLPFIQELDMETSTPFWWVSLLTSHLQEGFGQVEMSLRATIRNTPESHGSGLFSCVGIPEMLL